QKVIELRESQEGLETRMTDEEILAEVFGTSEGCNSRRGRRLPNTSSPSSSYSAHSHPPEPPMTEAQLAMYVAANNQQMATIYEHLRANNINIPPFVPLDHRRFLNATDENNDHPGDE
ncbi:hypothetical protein Tco_0223098, partial [Tanacetum coccineum]